MNSRLGGVWQTEVVHSNLNPSKTDWTTVVEAKQNGYDVYVNGKHHSFAHRQDVTSVKIIECWNDQFSVGKVSCVVNYCTIYSFCKGIPWVPRLRIFS